MPLHRQLTFSLSKDPFSARESILVSEHDISEIKEAIGELERSREQMREVLYSMLPQDIADDLFAGSINERAVVGRAGEGGDEQRKEGASSRNRRELYFAEKRAEGEINL